MCNSEIYQWWGESYLTGGAVSKDRVCHEPPGSAGVVHYRPNERFIDCYFNVNWLCFSAHTTTPIKWGRVAVLWERNFLCIYTHTSSVKRARGTPRFWRGIIYIQAVQGRGQDGTSWYPCWYFPGRRHFTFDHVQEKTFSISKNTTAVDILLLKLKVTWSVRLIHWSIVLWRARKPNRLVWSRSFLVWALGIF